MITTTDSVETLNEPLLRSPNEGQRFAASKRKVPARNQRFVMFCVILAVVLERLAYYSLLGNLAVYVTTVLKWDPDKTLTLTLMFTGFTWISCFIGGYLGDATFGRMNTITIGLIVYFLGFLCLPFISWLVENNETLGKKPFTVLWFVITLLLISFGEGCFKSNMSPFGADQGQSHHGHHHDKKMENFFSYYYWAINLGSLLGYGPVVYLQDREDFVYGYAVPAGFLLVALVFFLSAKRHYASNKPSSNMILKVYRIIKEAKAKKKMAKRNSDSSSPSEYAGSGCYENVMPMKHWLDRAMAKYGGSYLEIEVEEVKILFKTFPVFGFLVIYCMLYYQTSSTFVIQGMHMNTKMNIHDWYIPVAWLALTNIIFVLIFVPIIRKGLVQCLEKFNIHLPDFAKILIGMLIASLSLLSAGIVEVARLRTKETVTNKISNLNVTGRDISIFYQIPQFGLMGISEIFVLITGLEFAYCQAPKRMQAIVTGLFFIANGIGSMLGSLLCEVLALSSRGWFVSVKVSSTKRGTIGDLKGHLDYYFFGLAVLNLLNLLLFARYAWKTQVKKGTDSQQTVHEYIRAAMRASPTKM